MQAATTKEIPIGTRNLSANVPFDEWAAITRAARGRLGAKIRQLLLAGAEKEDPALAAEIRAARRQYYGVALLLFVGLLQSGLVAIREIELTAKAILGCFVLMIAVWTLFDDQSELRAGRSRARRRDDMCEVDNQPLNFTDV